MGFFLCLCKNCNSSLHVWEIELLKFYFFCFFLCLFSFCHDYMYRLNYLTIFTCIFAIHSIISKSHASLVIGLYSVTYLTTSTARLIIQAPGSYASLVLFLINHIMLSALSTSLSSVHSTTFTTCFFNSKTSSLLHPI